jgi:hypothetical protein
VIDRLIRPGRPPKEVILRKLRSFCPTALSPLEERLVLSQVGIAPSALEHHVPNFAAALPVHVLALNGTLSGTFVTTLNPVGIEPAGTTMTFQGTGTIIGWGQVKVTGFLETLTSTSGQRSTVESFTFTTTKGSITIQLTNSAPKPSTPNTVLSSFSIVKATGAFQGDTDAGTADLQRPAGTPTNWHEPGDSRRMLQFERNLSNQTSLYF